MNSSPTGEQPSRNRFILQVAAAMACRVLINTARRFPYPFAPELARGLGVSLPAVSALVAANPATGLLSPFFGPLGDRFGHRFVIIGGIALLSGAMLGAAALPSYGILLVAFILAGLSKAAYDPAILSYVAERIPYRRRGTAIGIVEMGWAGSTLAGVPAAGLLIDRFGWQSPFFAIGISAFLGTFVLLFLLSGNGGSKVRAKKTTSFLMSWKKIARSGPALGVLGFAFFVSAANDLFFIVFGVWMEESFHLSVIALGGSALLVGTAEFLGEIAVASLSDRIGLSRAVMIGTLLSGAAYGLIPVFGRSAAGALAVLFLIFLFVEFSIVTLISRATELLPEMRGTMMSGYIAASSAGRMTGALLGGPVWLLGKMSWIAAGSIVLTVLALVCLRIGFRGRE